MFHIVKTRPWGQIGDSVEKRREPKNLGTLRGGEKVGTLTASKVFTQRRLRTLAWSVQGEGRQGGVNGHTRGCHSRALLGKK